MFFYFFNQIFISFLFSIILSLIIILLSYFLNFQNSDFEKISAYECGFQPFEDARDKFDIRFYLVSILFIIFDLEVVFLFPWSVSLYFLNFFGFWTMFGFVLLLIIGFIYEWVKGALDWE